MSGEMPETQSDTCNSVLPSETPVLLEAINLTLRAFEDRARLYRNVVVAVSLVSVASLLTALVWWRAWPLAGLILAVPIAGVFLFLDDCRVLRWQGEILRLCQTRGLDTTQFVDTISQFKHLPRNSLQGMLLALSTAKAVSPTSGRREAPRDATSATRERNRDWKILAATAALTLALSGVAAAPYWRSLWPLLLAGAFAGLLVLLKRT
jgi:hypothetical protein